MSSMTRIIANAAHGRTHLRLRIPAGKEIPSSFLGVANRQVHMGISASVQFGCSSRFGAMFHGGFAAASASISLRLFLR